MFTMQVFMLMAMLMLTPSQQKFECGLRPLINKEKALAGRNMHIMGGLPAEFGEFPWHVYFGTLHLRTRAFEYQCGGTLISEMFVVTAAHCASPPELIQIVVLGEYNKNVASVPRKFLPVKRLGVKWIQHKRYHKMMDEDNNYIKNEYDIALIKMHRPVKFTEHIAPICLPADEADFAREMGTLAGWGILISGGRRPSQLMKVSLPILPPDKNDPKDLFASFKNGQRDACSGDSGGGLVVEQLAPKGQVRPWVLVGIVSSGDVCELPSLEFPKDKPAIYTRVSYFKDWIKTNAGLK